MAMTSLFVGGMRFDSSGRKRKTKAWKAPKAKKQVFKPITENLYAESSRRAKEHAEKYPSAKITNVCVTKDNSYRVKESSNFTVAPAYNKGAYQVISKDNIEHIGK